MAAHATLAGPGVLAGAHALAGLLVPRSHQCLGGRTSPRCGRRRKWGSGRTGRSGWWASCRRMRSPPHRVRTGVVVGDRGEWAWPEEESAEEGLLGEHRSHRGLGRRRWAGGRPGGGSRCPLDDGGVCRGDPARRRVGGVEGGAGSSGIQIALVPLARRDHEVLVLSEAVGVTERTVRTGRGVRAQSRGDVHRQDGPAVRSSGQRTVGQGVTRPVGLDPPVVEGSVQSAVPAALFGCERETDQSPHRSVRAQQGVAQLGGSVLARLAPCGAYASTYCSPLTQDAGAPATGQRAPSHPLIPRRMPRRPLAPCPAETGPCGGGEAGVTMAA